MNSQHALVTMGGRPTLPEYIRAVIVPNTRLYGTLARERLLAGFDDMHAQARIVEGETWQSWLASSGARDKDPVLGMLDAGVAGVGHYIALADLRQATLNLLAAMTYHLFEQHFALYKRRARFMRVPPLDWLGLPEGVSLAGQPVVDELRMVANVAKHGKADDTERLRALRRELFHNPLAEELGHVPRDEMPQAPFAGDGLFVRDADLPRYQTAVESLWLDIAAHHDASSTTVKP